MLFLDESDPRREVWEGCESAIEKLLCCAIFSYLGCKAVSGPFDEPRLPQLAEIAGEQPACFLFSQHSVGIYRVDFLLIAVDPQRRTSRRLVVECDGKDFHTSEQQIARDQKRDEEIAEAGLRVVRFTGSSIHSQMGSVIREIREWAEGCGVICERDSFATWLDIFTPSSAWNYERQQRRLEYWEAERAEERRSKPDFVTDIGTSGRWADTL